MYSAKMSPTQGITRSSNSMQICSAWLSISASFIAHMPGSTSESSGRMFIRQSSSFGSWRKITQTSVTMHTATTMGISSRSSPKATIGTLNTMPAQVGQATGRCPAFDRAWNSSYKAKQITSTTAAAITTPPSASSVAVTAARISAVMILCVNVCHAPCHSSGVPPRQSQIIYHLSEQDMNRPASLHFAIRPPKRRSRPP